MENKQSPKAFKTVIETYDDISIVKKSKFYSYLFPCDSVESFEKKLESIKKMHSGANHYCYAYRVMEQVLMERYQDDKEPSGTAGVPILDVLKGNDLIQCGIIVVRFFGGTKLGTGGLSRAYSKGAVNVVEFSDIVSKESAHIVEVEVDYGFSGKIEYYISRKKMALVDTRYESRIVYELAIKDDEEEEFQNSIMEITNGTCEYLVVERTMGYFMDGGFTEK